MKKLYLLAFIVFVSMFALISVSCSNGGGEEKSYEFSVHHSGSSSHPYQLGSEYFDEKLQEYSQGSMKLAIYPANQLAAGSKSVEGTALGTIDIFIDFLTFIKENITIMLYCSSCLDNWMLFF